MFTAKDVSADVEPYEIKIKSHETIIIKTYPVPFKYRHQVEPALEKMLERNVIEYSNSKHCNPICIVIKNDDTVRISLDARYVNNNIESDHETPPLIRELLQKFHGANLMSI